MSDVANTLKNLSEDPEVARRAIDREEAIYFYELALKKERELGEVAGEARGKAETVLKQITLKFGAPSETVQKRVRSASLEELDRFVERVLSSTTVEQLLAE